MLRASNYGLAIRAFEATLRVFRTTGTGLGVAAPTTISPGTRACQKHTPARSDPRNSTSPLEPMIHAGAMVANRLAPRSHGRRSSFKKASNAVQSVKNAAFRAAGASSPSLVARPSVPNRCKVWIGPSTGRRRSISMPIGVEFPTPIAKCVPESERLIWLPWSVPASFAAYLSSTRFMNTPRSPARQLTGMPATACSARQ